MKKFALLLLFVSFTKLFGQGEANIWYFGENAGLNFNSGAPNALTNGKLNTREGCSTFSDNKGNLLFYSDGTTVWNKNHNPMPNGTNLNGHPSSTQSAMIIPKPGSTNIYYLFTVGARVGGMGQFGFNYYIIDLTQDGGLGDVVAGPNDLSKVNSDNWSEKVAAIKGSQCGTFWVVSYSINTFFAYKVSASGVNSSPVTSNAQYISNDRRGYLKISPDGKKLAIAHMGDAAMLLYDFNATTGKVANKIQLPLTGVADKPYGVEFSASGQKLYVNASNDYYNDNYLLSNNPLNHFSSLYQFNISLPTTGEIIASRKIIDSQNLYRGALQLGPDQKIYRALSKTYDIGIPSLGVIENPEKEGIACNYQHAKIPLGGNNSTQGLPPFIASLLLPVKITDGITSENLNNTIIRRCIGENYTLVSQNIEGTPVYKWTFKGTIVSTSSKLSISNLNTSNEGTYFLEVKTTDKCGVPKTYIGQITIKAFKTPTITKPVDMSICDTDNDGFYNFDLDKLKDTEILNGQSSSEFEVVYFKNQTDANSNTNAISGIYTNQSPYSSDIIIARIHNKQLPTCFKTISFKITVFETPNPPSSIKNLEVCDSNTIGTDTDGKEIFDLTLKNNEILNKQNPANFIITYFSDSGFTSKISTPTNFKNTVVGKPQEIFFTEVNTQNNTCRVSGSFFINVNPLPTLLAKEVELKQCDDSNNDGFSIFNLNEANELISTNYKNETFEFYEDDTFNKQITNPIAYSNPAIANSSVYVRIKSKSNCERTAKINLKVGATQIPNDFLLEYRTCETSPSNNQGGRVYFNFSNATQKLIDSKPAFSAQPIRISYFESLNDALSEINSIQDISNYKNTTPWEQKIYARIDSDDVNACLGLKQIATLYIEPIPIANPVTIARQCDDDQDGFYAFDTSAIHQTILNGQTDVTVAYFDEQNKPLQSPLPNPFITKSQTIKIRVTNNISTITPACFDESYIDFIVDDAPVSYLVKIPPSCDNGDDTTDGIASFNTSSIETTLLGGQKNMVVSYTDENNNVLPSPLPNPFYTKTQSVTATITNPLNPTCVSSSKLDFVVNPLPYFEIKSEQIVCLNLLPKTLKVINPLDAYTYQWTNEQGTVISNKKTADITKGGVYTVIATSIKNCKSLPRIINVAESKIAQISYQDLTIVDDSEKNSITINTSNLGIGDYEFSLDDSFGPYQDEPYFDNIISGIHTLYIKDKNLCGITQIDVSIIGYPKFFTPNNDGYNDFWHVRGFREDFYPISQIYIFDRYGKIVSQIDPNSNGWDGNFNGNPLPASDYWFSVQLIDKNGVLREKKGHFSLIRR